MLSKYPRKLCFGYLLSRYEFMTGKFRSANLMADMCLNNIGEQVLPCLPPLPGALFAPGLGSCWMGPPPWNSSLLKIKTFEVSTNSPNSATRFVQGLKKKIHYHSWLKIKTVPMREPLTSVFASKSHGFP